MIDNFRILTGLALALIAEAAAATDVNVIGLFPSKAVVVVNGGKPRTLSVGEAARDGIRLLSVDGDQAVLEIDGKRRSLGMGQSISVAPANGGDGRAQATLGADAQGHFMASGQINGRSVRFLVDTGASMISMNASEAKRLGVNYLKGERGYAQTANGPATVYKVRLDTVRVGDISVNDIDALVHDGNALPLVLLGMSFLNRVEMRHDGPTMTLIKRY
ncbi:MAG TPA: TIGR02281 family clan AA aspartic protease [Burkholderiales bacterium]|nr:TIGR02281 family clan AA aspartic protease [Burkholderiales bacterium]